MPIILFLIVVILILSLLISIGVFVYGDAQKHGMDPVVWTLIAVLVPNLIGFIIYLVVRSGKKDSLKCPSCHMAIDNDYIKCPYCGTMLKSTCTNCGKPVNPDWKSCPYCSHEINMTNNYNRSINDSDNYNENNTFAYNDNYYSEVNDNKKGNRGLKIIIGIFIALILMIFITIAINFVSFKNISSSNVSIMETSSDTPVIVSEVLGKGSKSTMKSKYQYWSGVKEKKVDVEAGETVEIHYSSKVEEGELEIVLADEHNILIEEFPVDSAGEYSYTAVDSGTLIIKVSGHGTKGEYSIETEIVE